MKQRAPSALHTDMTYTPTQIPGMIEPVEQELLTDLAEYLDLADADVVCEFGCYFGRSARCIADGLTKNRQLNALRRQAPAFHAYDVFSCAASGALARYVLRDAKHAGISDLLQIDSSRVDFSRVFDHHLNDLPPGLVQRHQTDLAGARHVGGRIAMMHIDAPKWFNEYRQLLCEFGPHLRPGAQLVFQDYFYHWSAELIAATQLFIESGRFEPLETAATSLLVRVSGPVDAVALAWLDTQLAASDIDHVLQRAIKQFAAFEMDRPEIFLSRLYLAGMQYSFEAGNHQRASEWLSKLMRSLKGTVPPALIEDLADLTRYGFSIRSLYEQDTVRATP